MCDGVYDCFDGSDEWSSSCSSTTSGYGRGNTQYYTGLPVYAYALIGVGGVIGLGVLIGGITGEDLGKEKSNKGDPYPSSS